MQAKCMTHEVHERLWALLSIDEDRRKSEIEAEACGLPARIHPENGSNSLADSGNSVDTPGLCELVVTVPPGLALPKDKIINISVVEGRSKGLIFLVAYSLSRTLSNTDSGFSTFNFRGLNQLNPKAEWSIGNDDRTHVLNIAEVYELPLGPGKKLLNRGGLVMKNIVGGWQISGIYTYHTGTPVQLTACGAAFNCTPLAYSNGNNRPDVLAGPFSVDWNNYYRGLPVFNTSKFAFPGVWTIGNGAPLYTRLRNPFESNEMVGLAKKFFFGERVTAELRMEFDNVLNRMRPCASPDGEVTDSNFGIINGDPTSTCQGNNPRRGQAFFKITF